VCLCCDQRGSSRDLGSRHFGSYFARFFAYAAITDFSNAQNACEDMMTDSIRALHFARAVRITKLENEIRTPEIDPVMFVERILVHLQQILRDPKPKYHVGPKEKAFSAKNLTWIRGLSLQDARTLAVSLLGFSRELYLVAGRSPEQVACAVVMVALEGIARQPCPKQQEFDDELAWLTKTASFTIQERYREYIKALTDYAPKLPWVASKASKWKKKEVVEYTSDIVQFWRALDAKQKKDKAKKAEEELQARKAEEDLQAARMEEDLQRAGESEKGKWEGKIEGEDYASDQGRDQRQESEGVFVPQPQQEQEQPQQIEGMEEEEEEEGSDEEALPANLVADYDGSQADSPTASEDDLPDPMKSKTAADLYEFDQTEMAPSKRGGGGGIDKAVRSETVAKRAQEYVRGSPEWTRRRAAEAALAKGYRPSPSPALSPAPPTPEAYFPDLCLPTPPPLPVASSSKSSSKLNPNNNRPLTAVESQEILAYGHKPEAIRAQLAPGLKRDVGSNRSETRLSRLLWEKTAHDIEDEELFADGELESYLRTDAEALLVARTDIYSKMIRDANAQKHEEKEIRPRRRVRGQINPEFTELKNEAEKKGVSMETVLRRRSRKARGESDEEDVTREFRPRKKKSRIGDEARKRLAAFLAKNGSDEEEEQGEGGAPEWVGLAINVAGNVDGGIGEVDGVDDEDDEDEQEPEPDNAEGTDWKKQVQYAPLDGYGYDED